VIAVMCCDTVNRGVAYADNTIFLHQADTTIVALDAMTGEVKWTAVNGDPAKGETNTATVLPVKDKIIVGISGGEFGVRGHVTAYDMNSGEQLWRAYSTGPDEEMLVDPREHDGPRQADRRELLARQLGRRPVADRRRHHLGLVLLRSRARPDLLRHRQPLDLEPGAASRRQQVVHDLMARDPDDGMAKWFYQMTPHDEWDYDGVNENILADIEIDGSAAQDPDRSLGI
jgi:glucose dehydrogenase